MHYTGIAGRFLPECLYDFSTFCVIFEFENGLESSFFARNVRGAYPVIRTSHQPIKRLRLRDGPGVTNRKRIDMYVALKKQWDDLFSETQQPVFLPQPVTF